MCNVRIYEIIRSPEIDIPIFLSGYYVYVFGPFVLISSAFANTVL